MATREAKLEADIDDGERVSATINVVGTALLAALNTLDRDGLLKPDSEIKDISLVMGLFLEIAAIFEDAMSIDEEGQKWPEYIMTYAKEKCIELGDPPFGIAENLKEADTGAKLPTRSGKAAEDRFNFKKLVSLMLIWRKTQEVDNLLAQRFGKELWNVIRIQIQEQARGAPLRYHEVDTSRAREARF